MTPVNFVNYTSASNQGNYLIISHTQLFDDGAGTNWVEEYKNYRSSLPGGSYTVIVADIDKLYEQFSYGIKKTSIGHSQFYFICKR